MERVIRTKRVDGTHVSRKWSQDRITFAIQTIKDNEGSINQGYLGVHYPQLMQAIGNLPGGWGRQVEIAGFDPAQEAKRFKPSRDDSE